MVCERPVSTASGVVGRLAADRSGSVAMIFGFLVIPLCLGIGMAVDISRTRALRSSLQSAADNAALAAVAMAATGAPTSDASAAGVAYWNSNFAQINRPGMTVPAPTVTLQNVNGVATATVAFSGTQDAAFGKIVGINSLSANGMATAQSYQMVTKTNGVSGTGNVNGDPHVVGADGSYSTFPCPAGNWYSLLSDAWLEVNATCQRDLANSEDVINGFSVMLGTHNITFSIPKWDAAGNPATPWTPGLFAIDGTDYGGSAPALGTSATYLNGQVKAAFGSTDWGAQDPNIITVTTPQYTINMSFTSNGWGFVGITATGAGLCGVPGGLWGKTLAGIDDANSSDFKVAGPTDTTYEFTRSTCATASLGPHIIK